MAENPNPNYEEVAAESPIHYAALEEKNDGAEEKPGLNYGNGGESDSNDNLLAECHHGTWAEHSREKVEHDKFMAFRFVR